MLHSAPVHAQVASLQEQMSQHSAAAQQEAQAQMALLQGEITSLSDQLTREQAAHEAARAAASDLERRLADSDAARQQAIAQLGEQVQALQAELASAHAAAEAARQEAAAAGQKVSRQPVTKALACSVLPNGKYFRCGGSNLFGSTVGLIPM